MFLPVTIAANPLVNPLILASVRTPIQYELETDWLVGHVRFELRNVVANYPFERSHRFAESRRIPATEIIRV
jgi:hypothetical protein